MLAFFFLGGASVPERLAPRLQLTFLIGQRVLEHENQLLLIWARGKGILYASFMLGVEAIN